MRAVEVRIYFVAVRLYGGVNRLVLVTNCFTQRRKETARRKENLCGFASFFAALRETLILRDARIDVLGPGRDAAFQVNQPA